MKKLIHLGYYNDVDAVMLCKLSANEIMHNVFNKFGNFHVVNSDDVNEKYVMKLKHEYTSDGRYLITYDIIYTFEGQPYDEIEGNAEDEFIDIFKVVNE